MNKIYIQTLSPVHIGSGRDLTINTEFVKFQVDGYTILSVIDEEKTLRIIGEENIDNWINLIQRDGDLKEELLLKRKPNLKPDDIAKRNIYVFANDFSRNKTLKEQMHNGQNSAYIPGSSIKGAIRTAVVAELAIKNKLIAKKNLKDLKNRFNGQLIEKELFGKDPNSDVFRFLQVGDAYFGEYETIAKKSEVINLQGNGWRFKEGSSSLIECIKPDIDNVFFNMKINFELLVLNKVKSEFLSYKKLFSIINSHTKRLLREEIEFWEKQNNIRFDAFEQYIQNLKDLKKIADNCNEKEAVLRIGFGSGWSFITGDWATDEEIMNDYDYSKFLSIVRHKKYPDHIPFPKTRMIADDGELFGFVKLKMEK